jgi:hypothetical protein
VTKGTKPLSKLTIGLSGGLSFRARHGRHGAATVRGVTLAGGKAKPVTLVNGRLVIVLRDAGGRVTIRLGSAALRESAHLRSQAVHHRLKSLAIKVAVTNTAGRVSHLRLTIHQLGLAAGHR